MVRLVGFRFFSITFWCWGTKKIYFGQYSLISVWGTSRWFYTALATPRFYTMGYGGPLFGKISFLSSHFRLQELDIFHDFQLDTFQRFPDTQLNDCFLQDFFVARYRGGGSRTGNRVPGWDVGHHHPVLVVSFRSRFKKKAEGYCKGSIYWNWVMFSKVFGLTVFSV